MGYSVECLHTDDISFCHLLNTTSRIFTSQSSQNPLGLDGVLGPGCDSSESSLSLFRFSVADEKNDINFDCDIFVDWFIAYQ